MSAHQTWPNALVFPWGWTLAVSLGQANTTGHMPLFIQWVTQLHSVKTCLPLVSDLALAKKWIFWSLGIMWAAMDQMEKTDHH